MTSLSITARLQRISSQSSRMPVLALAPILQPQLTALQLGPHAGAPTLLSPTATLGPMSCPDDTEPQRQQRESAAHRAPSTRSYPAWQEDARHRPASSALGNRGTGQTKETPCTGGRSCQTAPTEPEPICAEPVPTPTRGPSYLNTAAASVVGCRVRATAASDTVQSQGAEGTPVKGCEAESALVRCRGRGETACPPVQATTSCLSP